MTDAESNGNDGGSAEKLPEATVDEVERLTRLARRASDDDEAALYRRERDRLLQEYGFAPRYRESDDTLVCYPSEWMADGTAQLDRIEDPDRASEITLSGPGDPDRYDEVETHNAEIVEAVADQYGAVHGANARAFADFMGNHYVKRVDRATADEIAEFREEYFPRNAWPSDEQRDRIAQSLSYVFEAADGSLPPGTQLSEELE
ncbi:hypothetical protein AArcSl_0072 [Halalkaliarchaeum desulfuricum]|uniref:RnhA operon protein n=1 Tax=Halalkaliarchaeum desulfuricum TaxID=2055893 RepID=A0A343TF58_9EURY|nr:rnhA operon protein [Halalkaliarchaeum desulfuricum]AUX07730.1 hypothetical protein AArcSl_0072 [Halalkaliarchaeum desulfuricum]